jgi:hypothetical protein
MAAVTEKTLHEMVQTLVQEIAPEQVYLFGSHARGTARPDSDVDLLIVESDPFGPHRSRRQELARIQRAAFTLGAAAELRGLVSAAGFCAPHIRLVVKMMRYPSLAEYLPGYVAATPMAGAVAAMEDARRTAMFQGLQTALRPYVEDTGLAVPMECHVMVART